MKPVSFTYQSAETVATAVAALSAGGTSAVSGNQSLGPMLNHRLARPQSLVDVSRIETLRQTEETRKSVVFGAAVTHAEIEDGTAPDPTGGWMREVAANIAHRAVRTRGTIAGSLCHADPAADWVTVLPALFAKVTIAGAGGTRQVDAADFVKGPYATALGPGELVISIEVPKPSKTARWGYWKFVRQVGEFAKASAAILSDPEYGRARLVIGALDRNPVVIRDALEVIDGQIDGKGILARALPGADTRMHAVAIDRARERLFT